MNLRKHVAGFIIFSVIVGSAILINAYLTASVAVIPPIHVNAPPTPQVQAPKIQPISYGVSQVMLNLTDNRSYTELRVRRLPGQPAPETLWVTTYFFSPAYPGHVWTDKTEIQQPFAQGDQTSLIAIAPCSLCLFINTPSSHLLNRASVESLPSTFPQGFFARVYISTEYADSLQMSPSHLDRDIRTASPVVIVWPDKAFQGRRDYTF